MDEWKVLLLGSWYFIGWCSTLLWLPAMGDKFGRKNLFWLGSALNAVATGIMLLTKSLIVMSICIFATGFLSALRQNIGYVYVMELVPRKFQTPLTSAIQIVGAFGYVIASVIFWKVNQRTLYYQLVGFVSYCICTILTFWLPESPRYLVQAGQLDKAKLVFEKIAKWNGKEYTWDPTYLLRPMNLKPD